MAGSRRQRTLVSMADVPRRYQLPDSHHALGEGWWPLLERLHEQLCAVDADYRLRDVKEKFGGLRVSVQLPDGLDVEAATRYHAETAVPIRSAEHASLGICENCGRPGQQHRPEGRPWGWIKTLCDTCQRDRRGPVRSAR